MRMNALASAALAAMGSSGILVVEGSEPARKRVPVKQAAPAAIHTYTRQIRRAEQRAAAHKMHGRQWRRAFA